MKVGIIMGGISSEREVSLNSGKSIINYMDKNKYEIVPIVIDKKNDVFEKVKDIDFAFIALHGKFGEDGIIQSVFETMDIPYSGCSPLTSGICMDKDISKKLLYSANINTAKWICIKSIEDIDYDYLENMGYPVVVKPNSGGSSVATTIIKKSEDIEEAARLAFNYDKEVMIEKYIEGDEITCCILDGTALPILAIKPNKGSFFDYTSKYADGGSEEIVVEFEKPLQSKIEEISLKCWELFKCKGYVRVDMILKDKVPYVLELNTLPGLTKNSLFPKSANGVNISFTKLLDKIIQCSM
ncbi:D-alanine--D-alanine ligase [Clostridium kluyveri]|uniref:D-alanine--D-alanine ligase n=1 Tax=Clostridium kluyveri TaxID=1534 RepID=A0A1L5FB01_CLOKL|nr:D-alanine--D-alanine ligase [Clostridium kluyveri]APM40157.1 D-alanine--D-alanine ligase [Clostridium kluyveri]